MPVYSYTFFRDFDNCPKKAYHKFVARDLPKEPIEGALKWGIEVHNALEQRLKRHLPLPDAMKAYEPFPAALEASGMPVHSEMMLGATRTYEPCDFFAGNVHIRGKVDASIMNTTTAFIADWKTGKKDEDAFELKLHALLLQIKLPTIKYLTGSYVWLKTNEMGAVHELSDTAEFHTGITRKIEEVESKASKNYWPAQQNPLCSYCPVLSCQFNKRGSK
jgi:hypothetical protein